ncbi:MAG TPA: nucleoside deaminase [Saprospiraceae bacterium]|nr:nucleoside deaminase [Saprospiraceae bacterium]HQW56459.1 nucleoside deaminase [Saprospiraceae bacterium]
MEDLYTDTYFMRMALREAQLAYEKDEVPIGALVVARNQIISRAHNQVEMLHDVTAHAEILAITAASQDYGSKYLTDCTLYVTIEPCCMCAGALRWAQFERVVYGADDEKYGFMRYGKEMLHPATKLAMGVCEVEARELIQRFFAEKRALKQL